jgi:hypothetical protein
LLSVTRRPFYGTGRFATSRLSRCCASTGFPKPPIIGHVAARYDHPSEHTPEWIDPIGHRAMKPKFGLGRRSGAEADRVERPEIEAIVGDQAAGGDEPSETAVEISRPPDDAPIRPDLGPPAPGPQSANQPGSGLGLVISVAVAAIVFVLAIYAAGGPTPNPLPLAQTTNALYWVVAAIATAASGIGALYADRTASRAAEREGTSAAGVSTAWMVPVIATAAAIVLVATFHNTTMIVAGPLIAFLGNAGALLSRDLLDDADDSAQRTANTVHALVVHVVAFLALSAIYLNKLPTPITALLSGGVSTLLALETLERSLIEHARKVTLALLAGGAVAVAAVPLMWWLTHGWTGGAVLFVVFYCALGVMQTVVERGAVRVRDAIEYGLVPLAAFLLLAITA